jgi:mannose-6-phosphate isomerase-like protein (cupin superfamily)
VTNPAWNFVSGQVWVGLNGEISDIYPNLPFDIPMGSVIDATNILVDNDQVIEN